MKTQINRLLMGGSLSILLGSGLQAQESDIAVVRNTQPQSNYSIAPNSETPLSMQELRNAHPQMLDNFAKHFPSATAVSWSRLNEYYQASFVLEGKKARAVFTNQDQLSYSVVQYRLQDLPVQLTELLSANYNGYTIFSAQEVKNRLGSCYNLVMEDASRFVNLKIAGDDIEEVSRIKKQK